MPQNFPQIPLPLADSDRPGFDQFRPGTGAALVAELQRTASGAATRNIYMWGEAGSGKSHLLHAACRAATAAGRRPGLLPLARRAAFTPALLESLEALDLVCVDDLDGIAGRGEWEQALFHLFNRMREAGRPLVFAARTSPAGSAVTLPDLKSRLGWDLVFHLRTLAESDRFAALRDRAAARGIEIPDEVMEYLSRRVARDMHSLFDWLDRLDRASLAAGKRLTVPFVRELLGPGAGDPAGTGAGNP